MANRKNTDRLEERPGGIRAVEVSRRLSLHAHVDGLVASYSLIVFPRNRRCSTPRARCCSRSWRYIDLDALVAAARKDIVFRQSSEAADTEVEAVSRMGHFPCKAAMGDPGLEPGTSSSEQARCNGQSSPVVKNAANRLVLGDASRPETTAVADLMHPKCTLKPSVAFAACLLQPSPTARLCRAVLHKSAFPSRRAA
jgi:hypothetical protein